jgi:diguanylate cyclase (GGDEF)-like protein
MERLIQHALVTIVQLSNSKSITLLKVEDKYRGVVVGGGVKGEIILCGKSLNWKGTPVEKIISTQEARTYPGTVVESLPFPANKETNSGFSCLCLPLLCEEDKNQVKGVLVLAQIRGKPLPSNRLETLNIFLPLLVSILEASSETERLVQLVTKDSLTNLYTRHYFETRLQEEFTRVRRHGGVFSLLMIDVDHFKQVNDTCGYKEGNKLLQDIAQLLNSSIRKGIDIPCRYNGKQFALLLPNTNVDGAYVLAERIRQRCENQKFTHKCAVKVTLSIGIAHNVDIAHEELLEENLDDSDSYQVTEISKEEVIHRADLMLHAAKQAGHNKVMVWW